MINDENNIQNIDENNRGNGENAGLQNGDFRQQDFSGGQHQENNRENGYSSAYVVNEQQSTQGSQNTYYNSYPTYGVNRMSYDPNADKKRKKRKTVLTAVISVLCAAAIIATGVLGYNLITTGNVGTFNSNSQHTNTGKKDQDTTEADAVKKPNKDLPTIYQLSAPEDALTIPQIVEKVSDSVVGITCITSGGAGVMGTGVIMSEDGYVITNAHVVSSATDITVVFTDDPENGIKAELVGIDVQTDLAVVKINKTGLTAAEFGKSSELQVGEAAIAIGNPISMNLAGSVTSGIISALNRELTIEDKKFNLIQTDAAINNGNSGGALINAYGQVIGITSAKVNSAVASNLGFAIPIDDAMPIINDLLQYGYVKGRPLLGISGNNISSFYSEYYGIPQGFRVEQVESGSAAETAGIKVGDIIVGIEGTLITSIDEFNDIKNEHTAGDTVTISLYRNGQRTDVKATLGEATQEQTEPQTQPTTSIFDMFGF